MTMIPMKVPTMVNVDSSMIEAVGYIDGHLFLTYTTGITYMYLSVSAIDFIDLLNAESIGTYVNNFIKPNFGYKKLESIDHKNQFVTVKD